MAFGEIDHDIVIFSIHRLLNKGFLDRFPIYHQRITVVTQGNLFCYLGAPTCTVFWAIKEDAAQRPDSVSQLGRFNPRPAVAIDFNSEGCRNAHPVKYSET